MPNINKTDLDEKVKKYICFLDDESKIWIFGSGFLGTDIVPLLKAYNLFGGLIDNDANKQANGWYGEKVWDIVEFLNQQSKFKILIATNEINSKAIRKQLISLGLCEYTDFIGYKEFIRYAFPIVSFHKYDKIFVELAQICVTERCTLKCKKCAHACNMVSNTAEDMSFEEVKISADNFFKYTDCVKEFNLIGGEPFLYKDIARAITYIGENYRNRIITFAITTNGTITPSDEIVSLCHKYDVTVRISNYERELPQLRNQYIKIREKLNDIKVIEWKTAEDSWFDYGLGEVDNGEEINILKSIFQGCLTPCREIRGNKYYYCVMARAVKDNRNLEDLTDDDYLLLNEQCSRYDFLDYQIGYLKKGYLEMCRYCRGGNAVNYRIKAAEQERTK